MGWSFVNKKSKLHFPCLNSFVSLSSFHSKFLEPNISRVKVCFKLGCTLTYIGVAWVYYIDHTYPVLSTLDNLCSLFRRWS